MKATMCDMCGQIIRDENRWEMNVHELFITNCFGRGDDNHVFDVCGKCMDAFLKSVRGEETNG